VRAKIVLLPGDGIGVDVVAEGRRVLEEVAAAYGHRFEFDEHPIGGHSIDQHGTALTDQALAACQAADAVLLGAVGAPKYDDPTRKVRPEQGLLRLRKGLGVFANLRPVKVHPALVNASPLRPEKLDGVDLLVVRELTGGLYFGPKSREDLPGGGVRVTDALTYQDDEIRRILELAFRLARGRRRKVTSVDKANILDTSRLWRQIATEVGAAHPDVALDHVLVDTAAMQLVAQPARFDVVVTENMFGDILTDEAAVLVGSMGMLPSASLGEGGPGLYEPIHGSAPDIAGKGIANPIGTILSVAMLLRHSLGLEHEAASIERAVDRAISDGYRTRDLGGTLATTAMTDEILRRLASSARADAS
jgi:3-isopropylmalate dehydrogenase